MNWVQLAQTEDLHLRPTAFRFDNNVFSWQASIVEPHHVTMEGRIGGEAGDMLAKAYTLSPRHFPRLLQALLSSVENVAIASRLLAEAMLNQPDDPIEVCRPFVSYGAHCIRAREIVFQTGSALAESSVIDIDDVLPPFAAHNHIVQRIGADTLFAVNAEATEPLSYSLTISFCFDLAEQLAVLEVYEPKFVTHLNTAIFWAIGGLMDAFVALIESGDLRLETCDPPSKLVNQLTNQSNWPLSKMFDYLGYS